MSLLLKRQQTGHLLALSTHISAAYRTCQSVACCDLEEEDDDDEDVRVSRETSREDEAETELSVEFADSARPRRPPRLRRRRFLPLDDGASPSVVVVVGGDAPFCSEDDRCLSVGNMGWLAPNADWHEVVEREAFAFDASSITPGEPCSLPAPASWTTTFDVFEADFWLESGFVPLPFFFDVDCLSETPTVVGGARGE